MDYILSFFKAPIPDWINQIEIRYQKMQPQERQTLPFYEIIWQFKNQLDQPTPQVKTEQLFNLVKKIKILSKEKLNYYQTSRFGFIKNFFSALRQAIKVGCWINSGQLGLNLSKEFIRNYKQEIEDRKLKEVEVEDLKLKEIEKSLSSPQNIKKEELEQLTLEPEDEELERNNGVEEEIWDQEMLEMALRQSLEEMPDGKPPLKAVETSKYNMLETVASVWEHATLDEKGGIQEVWATILKQAEVVKWEKTSQSNEYDLELSRELMGKKSSLAGNFFLQKEMTLRFQEELLENSDRYRKIINFPKGGLTYKFLTFNSSLNRIIVEEEKGNIKCKVEFNLLGTQNFTFSLPEAKLFWSQVSWQ